MDSSVLEEIGLTKSEIKVYLALLELGSSSTGKIVDKSKASSSKIYEILDKLMQKGLVSFIIKSGVKYFEAAPPDRIMDYMKEKESRLHAQRSALELILPELELKRQLSKYKSEATVFKGIKGLKTAMDDVLNTMKKGEEYYVMGSSASSEELLRFYRHFHTKRSKKGIKVKLLFSEQAREFAKNMKGIPLTQIKFAPSQLLASSFLLIYKGKILIIVQTKEDITSFRIENKETAGSFRSQFELLWKQRVQTYEGQDAVEIAYKSILEDVKPDDDTIIFAAKPNLQKASEYNLHWIGNMNKVVKRSRAIYYGDSKINRERTKQFESQGCRTKIIPTKQTLPISTVVSGDNILNTVWGKEPSAFMLNDRVVADSFRENFELLWNQEARILKGLDAIQDLLDEALEYGSLDWIGARGYFFDKRPRFIDRWEKRAVEQGFKIRNIVDTAVKGHRITNLSFIETKYTLPKEFSSLSVFWIYGNKVAITNWVEEEPIVIIIENKSLYDMYKKQFELLWNQEVNIIRGISGAYEAWDNMLDELNPDEEYYVMGTSWSGQKEKIDEWYIGFHKRRIAKKVKAKFLFVQGTEKILQKNKGLYYTLSGVRFLPKGVYEGMQINLYKNKVLMFVWREKEPIVISIEDPKVYATFKAYFDLLWDAG